MQKKIESFFDNDIVSFNHKYYSTLYCYVRDS